MMHLEPLENDHLPRKADQEHKQLVFDTNYLIAMQIVHSMYSDGLILDSELVKINAILTEKFSVSGISKMPRIA